MRCLLVFPDAGSYGGESMHGAAAPRAYRYAVCWCLLPSVEIQILGTYLYQISLP